MDSATDLRQPLLFSCGSGIFVPNISHNKGEPPRRPNTRENEQIQRDIELQLKGEDIVHQYVVQRPEKIKNDIINKIDFNLDFSEEVVYDRAHHLLPYKESYLSGLYNSSKIVPKKKKIASQTNGFRHNHKTAQIHSACIQSAQVKLKPLPKVKDTLPINDTDSLDSSLNGTTSTTSSEMKKRRMLKEVETKEDEYLLSLVSVNTARYLAFMVNHEEDRKIRLQNLVTEWYGPSPAILDLVPDDPKLFGDLPPPNSINKYMTTPISLLPKEDPEKKRWEKRTPLPILLANQMKEVTHDTDPYGDDTKPSFYRLPTGIRRSRTQTQTMIASSVNQTAQNVVFSPRQPTPPRTMREILNPRVGSKLFDTDNDYEKELLGGVRQLHTKDRDDKLHMATHNVYSKSLQKCFPPPSGLKELEDEFSDDSDSAEPVVTRQIQGFKRWTALPEIYNEGNVVLQHHASRGRTAANDPNDMQRSQIANRRRVRQNSALVRIVDEWRTKWHLNQKFAHSTPEDLLKDMSDIHPSIRVQAIITCAKSATYVPPPTDDMFAEFFLNKSSENDCLPEYLFEALERLVSDTHPQVSKAASISLFTLRRPTSAAEQLLRGLLKSGTDIDRWAAAQCLAFYGADDSDVVSELVDQMMTSEDSVVHEQATHLLALLSKTTRLVHGMLAERLNSNSWRQKVIVCKTFPALHGSLNRDLLKKLSTMMWDDWHHEVQTAAAQALGKTGQGKAVHNDLKKKLQHSNETVRADAVNKLGFLGLMTARLMPIFLTLFDDPYVSVRIEVCIACGRLKIKDKMILHKLMHMVQQESVWQVKAHAIRALGIIKMRSSAIRDMLIWAFRFEGEPGVRAEACHTMWMLDLLDEEFAVIMRNRYLVETNATVRKEIESCLKYLGISPSEDIEMVTQIKNEVRKLNKRREICEHIQKLEAIKDNQRLRHEMLATPDETAESQTRSESDDEQDDIIRDVHSAQSNPDQPAPTTTQSDKVHRLSIMPDEDDMPKRQARSAHARVISERRLYDDEEKDDDRNELHARISSARERDSIYAASPVHKRSHSSSLHRTSSLSHTTTLKTTSPTVQPITTSESTSQISSPPLIDDKKPADEPAGKAEPSQTSIDHLQLPAIIDPESPYRTSLKRSSYLQNQVEMRHNPFRLRGAADEEAMAAAQAHDGMVRDGLIWRKAEWTSLCWPNPNHEDIPLTDEMKSKLCQVDKIEGINLGPWTEEPKKSKKRSSKKKSIVKIVDEKDGEESCPAATETAEGANQSSDQTGDTPVQGSGDTLPVAISETDSILKQASLPLKEAPLLEENEDDYEMVQDERTESSTEDHTDAIGEEEGAVYCEEGRLENNNEDCDDSVTSTP